jgi:hypothetical protein
MQLLSLRIIANSCALNAVTDIKIYTQHNIMKSQKPEEKFQQKFQFSMNSACLLVALHKITGVLA